MRLGFKTSGGFIALVGLWLVLGAIGARPRAGEAAALGEFAWSAVTVEGERTLTSAELGAGPWVANFIFTRCAGPCPLLTERMGRVAKAARAGTRLVSFTVDPDHDTLERLRDYAAQAGVKSPQWYFVRLDKKALYDLANGYMRLPVARNDGADEGFRFTHSTRFVLMGPGNRLKDYFDSTDDAFPKRLVAALNKEMPS